VSDVCGCVRGSTLLCVCTLCTDFWRAVQQLLITLDNLRVCVTTRQQLQTSMCWRPRPNAQRRFWVDIFAKLKSWRSVAATCMRTHALISMHVYVIYVYLSLYLLYTYLYICIYISTYLSICLYVYTCIHTCTCIYIYMYTSMYVYMEIYIHLYICIYVYAHIYIKYVYIFIYKYVRIYMYAYIFNFSESQLYIYFRSSIVCQAVFWFFCIGRVHAHARSHLWCIDMLWCQFATQSTIWDNCIADFWKYK